MGKPETDATRTAHDAAPEAEESVQPSVLDEEDPLERVLALAAEDVRQGHGLPPAGYQREELYAEREERTVKRRGGSGK